MIEQGSSVRRKRFWRDVFWSGLGTLGAGAASFATQFGAAYVMQPAEYGQVALISVALPFCTITSLWTAVGAVRYGAVEYERTHKVTSTFSARLLLTLPLVVATLLLVWAAPDWMTSFFKLPVSTVQWLLVPVLGLTLQEHVSCIAVAQGRFRLAGVSGTVARIPALLLVGSSIALRRPVDIVAYVAAVGFGYLFAAVMTMIVLGWSSLRIARPEYYRIVELLRFGLPQFAGVAATLALVSAGPIALRFARDLSSVGRYQIANMVTNLALLVCTSLNTVLVPQLSRIDATYGGRARVEDFLRIAGPATAFYASAFLAAVAIPSGLVVGHFVGGDYRASGLVVPGVLCAAAFRLGSCVPGSTSNATARTVGVSVTNVVAALVSIVLTWHLTTEIGIAAPAIANAISMWLWISLSLVVLGVSAGKTLRAAIAMAVPPLLPIAISVTAYPVPPVLIAGWSVACLASIAFAPRILGIDRSALGDTLRMAGAPRSLAKLLAA